MLSSHLNFNASRASPQRYSLAQLAILALQIFYCFLLRLSLLGVSNFKLARIFPVNAIGRNCPAADWARSNIREVHLTDVPITLAIDVKEAHVVSIDFRDFDSLLTNFAPKVVLGFFLDVAWLVPALDLILLVLENYFVHQLVAHRAHKAIRNRVSGVVVSYSLPVVEAHCFLALS